jgi:hypothetical protein
MCGDRRIHDYIAFGSLHQECVAKSLDKADRFIDVNYFFSNPGKIGRVLSHPLLGACETRRYEENRQGN